MDDHLLEWLFENGGPSIRYRTAAELGYKPINIDIETLKSDLIKSSQVQKWLNRISFDNFAGLSFSEFHGSRNTLFENVTGKLSELGIKAGIKPLDDRIQPFQNWLNNNFSNSESIILAFNKSLVCGGLALTGYTNRKDLSSVIDNRIDELYHFTRMKNYEIYLTQKEKEKIPQRYKNKPIVESEICPNSGIKLPLIYDIFAIAHYQSDVNHEKTKEKIDTVIEYILDPLYQKSIYRDYGYFKDPSFKHRYYAMGWSVHLPGYNDFKFNDFEAGYFIQRLELFSNFPKARKHKWFLQSLSHLDSFRTKNRTWIFPRRYLKEQKNGYWVMGAYMGLEDNRRSQSAVELESTFHMLKLLRVSRKSQKE